jgi:hypothetical protein
MILANNEDALSWDEFLDAVDNDSSLISQLTSIINDY